MSVDPFPSERKEYQEALQVFSNLYDEVELYVFENWDENTQQLKPEALDEYRNKISKLQDAVGKREKKWEIYYNKILSLLST